MPFDRFMIAPLESGQETDKRPWLISDDAFEQLSNAYVFRGRVRKRVGSYLLDQDPLKSRLRINVGTTDAVTGNFSATMPGTYWAIGQQFSVGTTIFTVYQVSGATYTTGTATATYNTANGALVITGGTSNPLTSVFFYPAAPVMGLISYETNSINDEPTYAFDTQFAYSYSNGWNRLGTAIWTGTDAQFFWGSTYRGSTGADKFLFVTNFNAADGLKYWDSAAWNNFAPQLDATAGYVLKTARIILPFKNRLIALNTIEGSGNVNFQNRCRFSQNGSPIDANGWRDDIPGRGGFLDAPIVESIVTADFLRDRLIVYFERSTWELVYTGNEILPFRWQQINTELGAESTFSVIPFDRYVIGLGDVGIHQCNGTNVQRIDQKIPNKVFDDLSNKDDGRERIFGVRDYYNELIYWSYPEERRFPDNNTDYKYPNKMLVYNYTNGSWATNDDTITAFGYFQPTADATWESSVETWESSTGSWDGGQLDTLFKNILAGNQQGFTFILSRDQARNALAMQITNIVFTQYLVTITAINHNLQMGVDSVYGSNGNYVYISNVSGISGLNDQIYQVASIIDKDNFTVFAYEIPTGTYTGGGLISLVTPIDFYTKQYNFYVDKGRNAYIAKVDFQVDKTVAGEITVDSFTSSSDQSLVNFGELSGALMGNGILDTKPYDVALAPLEQYQGRLWHSVYPQAEGEFIQLRLYLSPLQVINLQEDPDTGDLFSDPVISFSDFELHAMTFYCTPTASRLQ